MNHLASFVGSLAVAAVGFVATVTAPAGPPLLLSAAVLVAGAVCAANVVLDRWVP
jgi:hypothetical protein